MTSDPDLEIRTLKKEMSIPAQTRHYILQITRHPEKIRQYQTNSHVDKSYD